MSKKELIVNTDKLMEIYDALDFYAGGLDDPITLDTLCAFILELDNDNFVKITMEEI